MWLNILVIESSKQSIWVTKFKIIILNFLLFLNLDLFFSEKQAGIYLVLRIEDIGELSPFT